MDVKGKVVTVFDLSWSRTPDIRPPVSVEALGAMLMEVRDRFIKEEGKAPKGWLGPFISQSPNTPELLLEAGYTYMMDWYFDEQPQWFRTDRGPILAVPYPSMELNDIPAIVARKENAADFADMIVDQFDEMLAQSRDQSLVLGIALHPYIVGQPFRLRQLRRAFEFQFLRRFVHLGREALADSAALS